MSVSNIKIAIVLAEQKQRAEALQYLDKALAISERLAKLDPANPVWRSDLAFVKAAISELQGKKIR